MNEPQTLQTLVKRALGDGTSGRQLAVRAEQAGHKVAFTTINAIAAGTYKSKPSAETIRAIAYLAGVSDEAAFTAAGYPLPGPPFADELPPGVDQLSARSRRAAVEILRALVEAETSQDGEGRGERPAPNREAPGTGATEIEVDLAARPKPPEGTLYERGRREDEIRTEQPDPPAPDDVDPPAPDEPS